MSLFQGNKLPAIFLASIIALMSIGPLSLFTDGFKTQIEKSLNGVVVIYTEDAETVGKDEVVPNYGLGTGFFIDENVIVTNHHVANKDTDSVTIQGHDSNTYFEARVINSDEKSDISIIQLNDWYNFKKEVDYEILELGNSNEVKVGDKVYAIGHPWGLNYSVSEGIVSYPNRISLLGDIREIQTDLKVYNGNSGGPLLNEQGEVIGINRRIVVNNGGSYPFSIPSNIVDKVVKSLAKQNKPLWPMVGLQLNTLHIFKYPVVDKITKMSPAEKFGFQVGDGIVKVKTKWGKTEVFSNEDLVAEVQQLVPGDEIEFEILRNGKKINIDMVL